MSKKTDAAKQKAKRAKPRRRAHARKGGRPNPALGLTGSDSIIDMLQNSAGQMMCMIAAREIGYMEAYYVLIGWKMLRKTIKTGEFANVVCTACGISAAAAHEKSMGLYCDKTESGMHRWTPAKPEGPEESELEEA